VTPHTAEEPKSRLFLTPADHGRTLGLDEFMGADAKEGFRYELIHGRLEVSPQAEMPHDRLRKCLERQLDRYAEERPDVINHVTSHARVILALPDDVSAPEPDLVAYHNFPDETGFEEIQWADVNPVLAIEIISPETADKDLGRNPALYLQIPTLWEYWVIDPRDESHDRPSMVVYRRRGRRWQKPIEVPAGGTYQTRFLPGFTLVLDPRAHEG
jgi:Uma2 family endonuclease